MCSTRHQRNGNALSAATSAKASFLRINALCAIRIRAASGKCEWAGCEWAGCEWAGCEWPNVDGYWTGIRGRKNFLKEFQKGVDSIWTEWYINQAASHESSKTKEKKQCRLQGTLITEQWNTHTNLKTFELQAWPKGHARRQKSENKSHSKKETGNWCLSS